MGTQRSRSLAAALLTTTLVLAACGGNADETTTEAAAEEPTSDWAADSSSDEPDGGDPETGDAPGAIGDISLERIAEMAAAGHIFLITYNVDEQQLEDYTSNPLWQQLPAVQAGNVHLVEGTAWTNHGPIGADAVLDEIEAALNDG